MSAVKRENKEDKGRCLRLCFFLLTTTSPIAFLLGAWSEHNSQFIHSVLSKFQSKFMGLQPATSTYHKHKTSQFKLLPQQTRDLVFIGDSLTDWGHWHELLPALTVANRGVAGDTTQRVLSRLDSTLSAGADIAVIMLGINDLRQKRSVEDTFNDYVSIIETLSGKEIPVVIQSTLYAGESRSEVNEQVRQLNEKLLEFAQQNKGVVFVDLNDALAPAGKLSPNFTEDDLHLNGSGYIAWSNELQTFLKSTFR